MTDPAEKLVSSLLDAGHLGRDVLLRAQSLAAETGEGYILHPSGRGRIVPNGVAIAVDPAGRSLLPRTNGRSVSSRTMARDCLPIETGFVILYGNGSFQKIRNPVNYNDPQGLFVGPGPGAKNSGSPATKPTDFQDAASSDDPQGIKAARAAANAGGLKTKDQRRQFHDAITGQGITDFHELLRIAKEIARRGA